jgi:hypothetical protein
MSPFDPARITAARAAISTLDKQINANRAELLSRCDRKPRNWRSWGHAWGRHPDLAARDHELFRQRGEAQLIRDSLEARAAAARAAAETRRHLARKPSKCPTCGTLTFARAA